MAVFYDTGGGDIYGGESREEILAAMCADGGAEFDFDKDMFEVSGDTKIRVTDEDENLTDELIALKDLYSPACGARMLASENC